MTSNTIVICAATSFELMGLEEKLKEISQQDEKQAVSIATFVHGVGIPNTIFALTSLFQKAKPKLLIQIGIAGTLDDTLELGEVVQVVEECFTDLGAEDSDGSILSLFDLALEEKNSLPYIAGKIRCDAAEDFEILTKVKGGTVNMVNGSASSIQQVKAKYPEVQVETMEGGAAAFVCAKMNVPMIQIRAISNKVEPRNRDNWEIEKALVNLNEVAGQVIALLAEGMKSAS